jgi:flagellar hook-basal body complex protein FliE
MANSISGVSSNPLGVSPGASPSPGGDKSAFFKALDGAMNQVNQLQGDASSKVTELLQGNGQDLHSAMIAVEKADISFQLMMQVRNKIIQAYQTISQLQF